MPEPLTQQTRWAPESWQSKFRRAARVICTLGASEHQWREKAIAAQAALQSTTADMNRYFEELTKLRERAEQAEAERDDLNDETQIVLELRNILGLKWGESITKRCKALRECDAMLASVTAERDELRTQLARESEWVRIYKQERDDALAGQPSSNALHFDTDEAGTLARVSVSLDEEKAGRLRAETKIEEMEGQLAAAQKAADAALAQQKERYEELLSDLRNNHLGEMAGLQSMLADARRQAAQLEVTQNSESAAQNAKGIAMEGAA